MSTVTKSAKRSIPLVVGNNPLTKIQTVARLLYWGRAIFAWAIRHRRSCSARSGEHLLGILLGSPVSAVPLRGYWRSSRSRNRRFAFQKIKQKNPQPEKWAVDKVVDKVVHRLSAVLWILTWGVDNCSGVSV